MLPESPYLSYRAYIAKHHLVPFRIYAIGLEGFIVLIQHINDCSITICNHHLVIRRANIASKQIESYWNITVVLVSLSSLPSDILAIGNHHNTQLASNYHTTCFVFLFEDIAHSLRHKEWNDHSSIGTNRSNHQNPFPILYNNLDHYYTSSK